MGPRHLGQGKVYCLYSDNCNIIYVGSTTERYLTTRKKCHRSKYIKWYNDYTRPWCSAYDIFRFKHHDIKLLENCPCEKKEVLLRCERSWMEKLQLDNKVVVVNKMTSIRTEEERQTLKTRWGCENYEENKERYKERFSCECGGRYTTINKFRHFRTKRHMNYKSNLELEGKKYLPS